MNNTFSSLFKRHAFWLAFLFILIILASFFAPLDKTLGEKSRLVYFHGAWVWAGKVVFAASALAGLVGLVLRRSSWQRASLALGRAGLFFWLTYLPLSLYVQQVNWGGIFWDEPRWRIPLAFGVAGLLLQVGLWMLNNLPAASLANLVFGAALWYFLGSIENVLHPDSPIFGAGAGGIQVFFSLLLVLSLAFGAVLGHFLYRRSGE